MVIIDVLAVKPSLFGLIRWADNQPDIDPRQPCCHVNSLLDHCSSFRAILLVIGQWSSAMGMHLSDTDVKGCTHVHKSLTAETRCLPRSCCPTTLSCREPMFAG